MPRVPWYGFWIKVKIVMILHVKVDYLLRLVGPPGPSTQVCFLATRIKLNEIKI